MKYIEEHELKVELDRLKIGYNIDGKHSAEYDTCMKILQIIDSIHKECIPIYSGWVARDKNSDLHYFKVKPVRFEARWFGGDYVSLPIDSHEYSDLRWEDEPIEVELLINKI